jgi:protoporphyrinogen oxidase
MEKRMSRRAVIIGAGPAGLTAAYELLTRSDVVPVVLEQDELVGGISRTVNYKGNRIDIGGHRFFSKSDRVMDWWLQILPMQRTPEGEMPLCYQGQSRNLAGGVGPDPETTDEVMLVRPRKSRIYYHRKFFDYPVSLSSGTIANLGLLHTARIGMSYMKARLAPRRPEANLEQFLINRFGRELYLTFFKSYTEKVWGVPCDEISAEWGAQRIKGLSIGKVVLNAVTRSFRSNGNGHQRHVETSLIEQFLYPKFGPGQMWETCARRVESLGGEVLLNQRVEQIRTDGNRIVAVTARDRRTGEQAVYEGDFFFSTMPIRNLVQAVDVDVPNEIRTIAAGLVYRDFVTVGLLMKELALRDGGRANACPSDNWIYVQEPDVRIARLQIFNNWSPYLVADQDTVWLGLEYICNTGDPLWSLADEAVSRLGIDELSRIGIIDRAKVLDSTVLRVPKAYPAYFGTYDRFPKLRTWLDRFENLFPLGRNGMHRYNNQDHSMLTAMVAVDQIVAGCCDKDQVWDVNTEQDYHEAKLERASTVRGV